MTSRTSTPETGRAQANAIMDAVNSRDFDGRLWRNDAYADPREALEAAGLAE